GGEQQRVALARAIVIHPRVLLFDEPLSNLDAKLRVQMRREIRDLQRRLGITTVYVTHDQEEAMAVSDRIAVMNQGSVMQIVTAVAPPCLGEKIEYVLRFGDETLQVVRYNARPGEVMAQGTPLSVRVIEDAVAVLPGAPA